MCLGPKAHERTTVESTHRYSCFFRCFACSVAQEEPRCALRTTMTNQNLSTGLHLSRCETVGKGCLLKTDVDFSMRNLKILV